MNMQRFYAVFVARNKEFLRDRGALVWSLVFPVFIILGLYFVFNEQKALYTVGHLGNTTIETQSVLGVDDALIEWVPITDLEQAKMRIGRHALDLLIDPDAQQYWVNSLSAEGQVVERLLQNDTSAAAWDRVEVSGEAIRYVDWALPGILSMNMMFAALFGIGYVIVRYRKSGMLKRLMATPVTAIEFLSAQLASRLLLMTCVNAALLFGLWFALDFRLIGSPLLLGLVLLLGATAMISIGLLVAARISNEELANGLLNATTWPMMMLSEVWFSMENAAPWLQKAAMVLPLSHMTKAARGVMLDGAGFTDIWQHLAYLLALTLVLMAVGAKLFRWE